MLKPGSTIGILGGGQLARMIALAAAPLGLKAHIFAPEDTSPAFDVASAHTRAAYDDEAVLERFARDVDVVTYEFENVPVATAEFLSEKAPVHPGARALGITPGPASGEELHCRARHRGGALRRGARCRRAGARAYPHRPPLGAEDPPLRL
jgi:hypothetical protein